jgi:hypothetical protein
MKMQQQRPEHEQKEIQDYINKWQGKVPSFVFTQMVLKFIQELDTRSRLQKIEE